MTNFERFFCNTIAWNPSLINFFSSWCVPPPWLSVIWNFKSGFFSWQVATDEVLWRPPYFFFEILWKSVRKFESNASASENIWDVETCWVNCVRCFLFPYPMKPSNGVQLWYCTEELTYGHYIYMVLKSHHEA